MLKQMIAGGAVSLNKAKEEINSLNVFPVPDGDTGTNMNLTVKSAKEEAEKVTTNHAGEVAKAISKGALMGARGNSGVILSQLFRGFAKELEQYAEIDVKTFIKAMNSGVNTAYKAVMKPVEGTILTVAKDAAKGGQKYVRNKSETNFNELLNYVIQSTDEGVQRTPQQLKVLKEAGVVDAGGKGLYYIYYGFLMGLSGEDFSSLKVDIPIAESQIPEGHHEEDADLVYKFCTEFILSGVNQPEETEKTLKQELMAYGDSLLVVGETDIVKVHVHTNRPGKVLEDSMKFGELTDIKIDNMKKQHDTEIIKNEEPGDSKEDEFNEEQIDKVGVITVVNGAGFDEIFQSLGASHVVTGGQTMNPSTEDLINAINQIPESSVILLPNNKNIIMACEQAKEISDKQVEVIPTKTIPQGISSMMAFDPEADDMKEMAEDMGDASQEVITGEITYAVRDTKIDDMDIKKDEIIAIVDGKITNHGTESEQVLLDALNDLVSEDHEIITIYYGENTNKSKVDNLISDLEGIFTDCEIESHYGGQPLYYYTFSVE